MNNTPNYNLLKPEYADFADVEKLNENMDILDAVVKQVADMAGDTALSQRLDAHILNMAQHNQVMDGAQKKQLIFGINPVLNCLTIDEVNI